MNNKINIQKTITDVIGNTDVIGRSSVLGRNI